MIIEERWVTYINSLDTGHTPFLENLERTAKQDRVPIIRREMQSFLKVFLKMKQPKRILEVGTAVGFSAVFMAQYGEPDAEITTIENYEKRIPIARENGEKSGFADRITLIPGDAAEVLKTLDGPYDFIFMDAAKGQYIHFLPEVLRLLDEHGVLIRRGKLFVSGGNQFGLMLQRGPCLFPERFVKDEETEHGGADQTDEAHEKQPVTDFFFHALRFHSSSPSSLSASL